MERVTMDCKISDLLGKTLKSVTISNADSDAIYFITEEGTKYKMHHWQDCCESVTIEDVCGDLQGLIGSPILEAEEVTSGENPTDAKVDIEYQESFTWTFYKLGTAKGSVTIRWYGESNGWYSESVDFEEIVEGGE